MDPESPPVVADDRDVAALPPATRGVHVTFAVLFGALVVLSVLILIEQLDEVLPQGLSEHVARNNEGYVFAILLAVWIEYARAPVAATTRQWTIVGVASAGLAIAGAVLLLDGVPGTLATLNETCFALALLVPYVQLRRPIPRWTWAMPLCAVLVPIVSGGYDDIAELAEFFGFLLLIPIAVEVVDRSILDPTGRRRPDLLAIWSIGLSICAVTFHSLRPENPEGVVDEVLLYLSRTVEVVIAILILHLYFSILRPAVVRHGR
jgi:hypothetical protein